MIAENPGNPEIAKDEAGAGMRDVENLQEKKR